MAKHHLQLLQAVQHSLHVLQKCREEYRHISSRREFVQLFDEEQD